MAEPQPKQPFTNEMIHDFADYMETLRSEGGCARFSDVNLMDIYQLASNVYILDINHESGEWIVRFVGTKMAQDFGQDFTGKDLRSIIQGNTKDSILDALTRVIDKEKPVWAKATATPVPDEKTSNSQPKTIAYERIAYPLLGDADRVDYVIGLVVVYPHSRELQATEVIELP